MSSTPPPMPTCAHVLDAATNSSSEQAAATDRGATSSAASPV
eukprot:CAMPEP_0176171130 /NCGR_PEP_ID=MMETSP0120_2-20121206/87604_1 /TAXON_ID=160619 /ORGANISM="Kryptoperidinium foliaceum, Strain CCMP 1326" /LENGTH=41 /DNA_ID= /DNA_START= /DNA_END= /DNA_ORIENTATION=